MIDRQAVRAREVPKAVVCRRKASGKPSPWTERMAALGAYRVLHVPSFDEASLTLDECGTRRVAEERIPPGGDGLVRIGAKPLGLAELSFVGN
ncbi:hypothetical protein [Ferrimicrobium sp.]|uniref:hypothetical protein n=1 Tax=Ferrimicrobium sp. TaxID=2926050 RepID=UPI00260CFC84|nr:hypothetical protein [Ferrimicrobium sp.]